MGLGLGLGLGLGVGCSPKPHMAWRTSFIQTMPAGAMGMDSWLGLGLG